MQLLKTGIGKTSHAAVENRGPEERRAISRIDCGVRDPRTPLQERTWARGFPGNVRSRPSALLRGPGVSDGIVPALAELVALRAAAQGRRPPPLGCHGVTGQAPSPRRGGGCGQGESREWPPGEIG